MNGSRVGERGQEMPLFAFNKAVQFNSSPFKLVKCFL